MSGSGAAWILYVEDSEDDVRLVREILPESSYPLTWAPTAAAARKHLDAVRFDLVLLDHGLPDSNGLVLLDEIRRSQPDLPVVFLTGRDDEALASSALRRGASDYILKDDMLDGLPALVRAILDRIPSGGRRPTAGGSRAAGGGPHDRISRILLETMNEGSLVVDAEGIVTFASAPAGRLIGCAADALLGHAARDLFDEPTSRSFLAFHRSVLESERPRSLQLEGRLRGGRRDGDPSGRPVLLSGRSVRSELGKHEACLVVLADISELVEARNALRARVADLERLQRFFLDREKRIVELKALLRDQDRRQGVETPRLSEETRRELERRLGTGGRRAEQVLLHLTPPGVGGVPSPAAGEDASVREALLSLLEDLDVARLELAGANVRIARLDRLKTELVSAVSQDLRSPITAIRGAVEGLLDGSLGRLEAAQRRTLEMVLRNAMRMAPLIDRLLALGHPEGGESRLREDPAAPGPGG